MLHFSYVPHVTELQMKNSMRSISEINPDGAENYGQ